MDELAALARDTLELLEKNNINNANVFDTVSYFYFLFLFFRSQVEKQKQNKKQSSLDVEKRIAVGQRVVKLKRTFDEGIEPRLEKEELATLASLLRSWLLTLDAPLLTFTIGQLFMEVFIFNELSFVLFVF